MAYTFISGATGGIGMAFAVKCAEAGYDLFLTGRGGEKLTKLKEELAGLNPEINILTFPCQLTSASDRFKMISYADERAISFDRIINVAGVDIQKPFIEYTDEKVVMQIRVNAEATLTHALLKRGAPGKEIITVSSMSGVTPMPYFALYSATKAMLTGFFTSLRIELKGKTNVTVVLPGGVYTRPDIIADIKGQGLWGKLSAKTPEYVAKKSLKAVKKNKAKYIPGFFNKFLNFVLHITPLSLSMRFIANRWKKIRKDAF